MQLVNEVYQIRTLQDFSFLDKNEDKGIFGFQKFVCNNYIAIFYLFKVREKANNIIEILISRKRIAEIRSQGDSIKDKIYGRNSKNFLKIYYELYIYYSI
jgi:hypothetical protein